jgi:HEAT repeat protein/MFS family permease
MSRELTNVQKIRALPWGIAHAASNSVYCQLTFFGSAFVLFLSEIGLSKTQMGSLLSLMPFSALMALFIAPVIARFGYKRTFLTFWGIRKAATVFLLATPWLLSRFGPQAVLTSIVGIVATFAICRAIAMTAMYPWQQEYIPNRVRGKYTAIQSLFSSMASFLTVTAAGYFIGESPGLNKFITLFAIGVFFGVISVWSASYIPGGAPIQQSVARRTRPWNIFATIRDRSFLLYLVGISLISLGTGPLSSFLPLFMQEQVGLSAGNVVFLTTGSLMGGILSSYLWGWMADRYGSKPVMLSSVYLIAALPICWLLMPRQATWSFTIALGIAFLQGFINMGWSIGSGRLLFVSLVPPKKRTEYMALYYAWTGIVGGLGQLLGGRVLDYASEIEGQFLNLSLDAYSILFVAGLALPLIAAMLFRRVRADSTVTTAEFAGMFLRGNPFGAVRSLIGFHRAKDERATISMTEQLGQTHSPLTVDELLEALADPRFYVRFEAIVSIARMPPDNRSIQAVIEILKGNEPALSVIAAWALGRIGDRRAIEPLREGLDARYRSIQAHCVRSLGTLGDQGAVPILLERLENEIRADNGDAGLQTAYGAALGQLRAEKATSTLLGMLHDSQDPAVQMELALALARIVGEEQRFIQLLRQTDTEIGTATSQAVFALKKKLDDHQSKFGDLLELIDECADTLARQDLEHGIPLIRQVVLQLPMEGMSEARRSILEDCAERMAEFGIARTEYVILALHTANTAFERAQTGTFVRAFSPENLDS